VRLLIILVFICSYSALGSQEPCDFKPISPVAHKTVLSGSYGEPRSRHFHAGIDFKQSKGIPHDTVYAVEDGYISRINVKADGYGQALYIDHPCDVTTVYAHLHDFAPAIRSYIDKVMYKDKTYSISHRLSEGLIKVTKGQMIGILGNSGRSSGPHLHFETRQTSTEVAFNPGLVGLKPKDNIRPSIVGIYLYDITPDGEILSKQYHKAHKVRNGSYRLDQEILMSSSLSVGVGIRVYDQMNGASNHNGIYRLEMLVDGRSGFSFRLDSIPFDRSKYIHSHMDYEEKKNKKYVTKCFVDPGNQLKIYQTDSLTGHVKLFDYKASHITINAFDLEANKSTISFKIRRVGSPKYIHSPLRSLVRVTPQDSLTIAAGRSNMHLEQGTFSTPTRIRPPRASHATIDLSQDQKIPTFRYIHLSHKMDSLHYPKEKYALVSVNDKAEKERYVSEWLGDTLLTTFVEELKTYHLEVDTIAPLVRVIHLPGGKDHLIRFQIVDNLNPIFDKDQIDIDVYCDDRWILCRLDAKTHTVTGHIPSALATSGLHTIKVVAIDAAGNRSEESRSVTLD